MPGRGRMAAGHRSRARQGVFLLPANNRDAWTFTTRSPKKRDEKMRAQGWLAVVSVCMCTASCGLAACTQPCERRGRVYLAEVAVSAVSGWWRPCTNNCVFLCYVTAVLGFYLARAAF